MCVCVCAGVFNSDKNPPALGPEHLRQTLGTQEKERRRRRKRKKRELGQVTSFLTCAHTHTHTHTQPELATTDQKKKRAHSVAFLRPESVTFNLKIPIDRKLLFHIPVSPFPTKLNAIPLLSLSKLNQLTLGNWTKKKSLSFKMMKRKKKKKADAPLRPCSQQVAPLFLLLLRLLF